MGGLKTELGATTVEHRTGSTSNRNHNTTPFNDFLISIKGGPDKNSGKVDDDELIWVHGEHLSIQNLVKKHLFVYCKQVRQ